MLSKTSPVRFCASITLQQYDSVQRVVFHLDWFTVCRIGFQVLEVCGYQLI